MEKRWKWASAALVLLAMGTVVSASTVYTDDFESGYGNGDNITQYPAWSGNPDPDQAPIVEYGSGVAGSNGLGQASKSFQWKAHQFDFSNPAITGIKMSMDFETTWLTGDLTEDTYKPFDDDYLGWSVVEDSTSSSDIFGVALEGRELRAVWRNSATNSTAPYGTGVNRVIQTITAPLPQLSWWRLSVEYTKLANGTGVQMDASLTAIDANGNLGDVVASGTILDTSNLGSAKANANPAWLVGPSWLMAKNWNTNAGNADNVYLEIIPEPASVLLLGAGGLLLLKRRRRA